MNLLSEAIKGLSYLRKEGFLGFIYRIRSKYSCPIPLSAKTRWDLGKNSEIDYWNEWFRTKGPDDTVACHGYYGADLYWPKLDPDLSLQSRVASLLPAINEVSILDVGAGPLTYLGKKCEGKKINITAIDSLAEEYDKLLDKYKIFPLVRTIQGDAEELTKKFPTNSFDLVFARNCLDHTYNPEKAIKQMLKVVKKSCYVLLEHFLNEGDNTNFEGLHQWNLYMNEKKEFIIASRFKQVNMSQKYKKLCVIKCETTEINHCSWLIVKIRKKV